MLILSRKRDWKNERSNFHWESHHVRLWVFKHREDTSFFEKIHNKRRYFSASLRKNCFTFYHLWQPVYDRFVEKCSAKIFFQDCSDLKTLPVRTYWNCNSLLKFSSALKSPSHHPTKHLRQKVLNIAKKNIWALQNLLLEREEKI